MAQKTNEYDHVSGSERKAQLKPPKAPKAEDTTQSLMKESGKSRRYIYRCIEYFESLQTIERVYGEQARLNILNRVVKLTHNEVHVLAAIATVYTESDYLGEYIGKAIRDGRHEWIKSFLKDMMKPNRRN